MGIFSKIKNIFKKQEEINNKIELDNKVTNEELKEVVETNKYVEGLSKSRDEFVNKLSILGIKYTKINDSFYDELEEILISADIGVNTVMDFVDKEALGNTYCENKDGKFTDYGLIFLTSDLVFDKEEEFE